MWNRQSVPHPDKATMALQVILNLTSAVIDDSLLRGEGQRERVELYMSRRMHRYVLGRPLSLTFSHKGREDLVRSDNRAHLTQHADLLALDQVEVDLCTEARLFELRDVHVAVLVHFDILEKAVLLSAVR